MVGFNLPYLIFFKKEEKTQIKKQADTPILL
jgi:hypothetical protein